MIPAAEALEINRETIAQSMNWNGQIPVASVSQVSCRLLDFAVDIWTPQFVIPAAETFLKINPEVATQDTSRDPQTPVATVTLVSCRLLDFAVEIWTPQFVIPDA